MLTQRTVYQGHAAIQGRTKVDAAEPYEGTGGESVQEGICTKGTAVNCLDGMMRWGVGWVSRYQASDR